ncbi:N-acetylmuramoyl-L-alanine amidase [Budvicia diplopodorum]|uniref:N-acetylmuramoyl-L-alanine amidase n=1 Tax=Budvicia diplopodorum TaxID=1119056 RepID=UPI00135C8767
MLVLAILSLFNSGCSSLHHRGNYWVDDSYRAKGAEPRVLFLVFHYTAGDFPTSREILTGDNVSVHYLIDTEPDTQNGQPIALQLVPESMRAWHAGASYWRGRTNLNDTSLGIEIVNLGFNKAKGIGHWQPFTDSQIELVIAVSRDIIQRNGIAAVNVVGHSDISPGRKVDPGPLFPWEKLADAGVGAWPDAQTVNRYLIQRRSEAAIDVKALQNNLSRYGYQVPETGVMDEETSRVVKAFQMHFRPTDYSGVPDVETLAILDALLDKYPR